MARKIGVKKVEVNISDKWPLRQETQLKLSVRQRLSLGIFGQTFIGFKESAGNSDIPQYLVKCPTHGLFITGPRGYSKKKECVKCLEENLRQLDLI
jgi:hypothetical protein